MPEDVCISTIPSLNRSFVSLHSIFKLVDLCGMIFFQVFNTCGILIFKSLDVRSVAIELVAAFQLEVYVRLTFRCQGLRRIIKILFCGFDDSFPLCYMKTRRLHVILDLVVLRFLGF